MRRRRFHAIRRLNHPTPPTQHTNGVLHNLRYQRDPDFTKVNLHIVLQVQCCIVYSPSVWQCEMTLEIMQQCTISTV